MNSSSASGLTLPSIDSARSADRSRFCCSSRTNGTGSGRRLRVGVELGLLLGGEHRRHEVVRAVVRRPARRPSSPSSSSARSSSCSMRIRCWVRAISSRCTVLTSSSSSLARSRSRPRTAIELLLAAAAGLLDGGPLVGGGRDRDLEPLRGRPRRRGRPPRRPGPRGAAARGGRRRGPGRPARPGRPCAASRRGRCSARARSSAVRSASRASISAWRPARAASASRSRSVGVGLLVGGVLGGGQPLPRARRGRRGRARGPPRRLGDRGGDPLGLALAPTGPASRAGRAPRRPPPGWRRTRAAWPARRRPGAGAWARSSSSRARSKPSRSQAWVASRELRGRPRRPRPAPRSGWAATTSRRRRSARRAGRPRG